MNDSRPQHTIVLAGDGVPGPGADAPCYECMARAVAGCAEAGATG